jgi:hypothetical protein
MVIKMIACSGLINTAPRSFENVAELKYLGEAVTHHNLICEEIRSRFC